MKRLKNMIYFTHGKQIPVATRLIVEGEPSLGFKKGEKIIAYMTWEELRQQMLSGPYTEFNAPTEARKLSSPNACELVG